MIIYCHDCDHTFVESQTVFEADEMLCPFCEGANWDGYPEDEQDDLLPCVEDREDR